MLRRLLLVLSLLLLASPAFATLSANDAAVLRANVKATVFEKLFAVGTGSTASPATVPAADLDHVLTSQEVHDALYDDNGNAI